MLEAMLKIKMGYSFFAKSFGSLGTNGINFEFCMKYLILLNGFVCCREFPTLKTMSCLLVTLLSYCCGNCSKPKTYILADIIFGANKIFHFSFQQFVRSLQFFFGFQSLFKCSGQ